MGKKLDYVLHVIKNIINEVVEFFVEYIKEPIDEGHTLHSKVQETIIGSSIGLGILGGPLICLIGSFIFGFGGIWAIIILKFIITSFSLMLLTGFSTYLILEISLGYYVVQRNIKKAFSQFKVNAEKHSNEAEK